MKKLILPLALVAFSLLPGAQRAEAFARATPDGSFLSATLPGPAKDKSGTRDTVVGDITHNTLSTADGDAEFSITATQLPGFVTTVTTDNMIYRKARNELLGNYSARRTAWRKCSHAGHECRKLRYRTGDGRRGMARFYLDGDTLVVANAVYRGDKDGARDFLASVR
ncbi:MAG: hypothetical protein ACE37F_32535 [Nannocystaceae bacterium]|nr:hypothetical protein [bacterium]